MGRSVRKVDVRIKVRGEPTDECDAGVPGVYLLEADVRDGDEGAALTQSTMERVHEMALDGFHQKIGIACLDDFEIEVTCQARDSVEYVIGSMSEGVDRGLAFWSNGDGWGSLAGASRFATAERMSFALPQSSGMDAEWMLIEEAADVETESSGRPQGGDDVVVRYMGKA